MLRATVNEEFSIEVDRQDTSWAINKKRVSFDISKLGDGYYHLLLNNKAYTAKLLSHDRRAKSFEWLINGKKMSLILEDDFDELLQKMGIDKNLTALVSEIQAPMPGLVLDVLVENGQTISEGDALFVLEAMKMENVIKSPCDAIIKSIQVEKNQKIDKDDILVVFDS